MAQQNEDRASVCIGCGRRDTRHPSKVCRKCNEKRGCEDRFDDDNKNDEVDADDIRSWRDEHREDAEPMTA